MLEGFIESGIPGKFPWSAEDVRTVLESNFGSVEKGIETIAGNSDLVTKSVPSWAPARSDMPVIDPQQVPEAAKSMQKGEVDWTAPYKKSFRERLTRLAKEHPELRPTLVPMIREIG